MKHLWLIIIFQSLAVLSFASSVTVKIQGEKTSFTCEDEGKGSYICQKEGKSFLVFPSVGYDGALGYYSSIGYNSKYPDILNTFFVTEIKKGAELLYSNQTIARRESSNTEQSQNTQTNDGMVMNNLFGKMTFSTPPPSENENSLRTVYTDSSLASMMMAKVVTSSVFGGKNISENDLYRSKGGEKFEKIFALMKKNYDEQRSKIKDSLKNGRFILELEDGEQIPCQKGEDVTNQVKQNTDSDYPENLGAINSCQLLSCGPIERDGKKQEVSLIFPYTVGEMGIEEPQAILIDPKEGMTKKLPVSSVYNFSLKNPLYSKNPEYEKYLKDLQNDLQKDVEKYNLKNFPFASQRPKDFEAQMTDSIMRENYKSIEASCVPQSKAYILFDSNYLKLRTSFANKEVVELLRFDLDSLILTNQFGRKGEVGPEYCLENGVYYSQEAKKNKEKFKPIKELNNPKTITLVEAKKLFNEALAMKDIAWNYKADGCYARAHLMARRFEKKGIDVGKVWIKGDLLVPSEKIEWNYHVAPIVYVKNEKGGVERMVIDPSLTTEPVTVQQWSAKMKKGVVGRDTYTQFPFPENASSFERTAISFSSSNPYFAESVLDMPESEKIDSANETMKEYKEISP